MEQSTDSFFFPTYKRLPLSVVSADGVYIITEDGQRYLDMFSGVAVNILGHRHPRIIHAIEEQMKSYLHLSNYFSQQPQINLASMLIRESGFQRVFFCNSGTEAVEGALKIARKWGSTRNKKTIISISNAFHGRTLGALSIMDRPKYRDGFEPLLTNMKSIPFNDGESLQQTVGPDVSAVILECIQGEGGVRPISTEFASTLAALQRKFDFLIIADEIQSGLGRTGKFFGFQHTGLNPDIVLLAKALGGGLPLGAILGNEKVESVLQPGTHGSTFGGNPLACAAGAAVLEELSHSNLLQHAETLGEYFKTELLRLKQKHPALVKEVRGLGLMIGCELHEPVDPYVDVMRERSILVNGTDQTVMRFLPPLIITKEHVDSTIFALDAVFTSNKKAGT